MKSVNSIENNALTSSGGLSDGFSDGLFADKFSATMEKVLSANGKSMPLNLAALKEFGIQQLTELEELRGISAPSELEELRGISMPSYAIALKQQPDLNIPALETNAQLENIDLFGNPEANELLKTNIINANLSEENGLNKQFNKSEGLAGKVIMQPTQQGIFKNEAGLSSVLDEINLSQHMKQSTNSDVDTISELLTQPSRQEVNVTKLVDHLASIDKPINAINPANNHSVKTYSSLDQPGTMLSRIDVPVTQPGWSEAVGSRLMMMVNGKIQSANIHLNPAELGPIEIRVNINQEQASVQFVSNNPLVREAIEDAFPRLKEMFSENGLSLADANVSEQSSQQGRQYSSEQNNPLTGNNNESLETADVQINNPDDNIIDIGFIDHYV